MARESTHSKDTTTLSWKMSDVGGNDSSTGDDLKQILRKATAAALNTNETVEDFSTLPSLSLNPSSSSSSFSVSKAFSAAKKKRQARRQEKRDDSKVRAKTNAPPIEVVKASPKRSDTKVAVGKNLHVNAPHVIPIDRIEVQNGREHTLPPSDSWTGSPARNRRRSTSRGNIRRSDSDSASSDRSESYLRAEKLLKKLDQRRASSPLKSLKTRPTSPLRYGSPLPGTRVSSPLARQPASPKSPKSTTSSKQRSTSRSSVRQRGASVREKAKLFELHSETKQPPASKHVARPIPAVLGSDTNSIASSKASASKKPRAIVTSSVQPQKSNPQSLRKPSVAKMPTSPQSQPPPSRGNRSFAKPPVSSWPQSPNSSKLPAERRPADPSRSKSAPPVRPNGVQFQEQSIVSKAKELHESRKARARTLAVNTSDSVVTGNRASITGKSEGTGTKSKRKKKKSQKQKLLDRLDKLGLKQDDALTGGLGTIVLSPSQEVGSPKNSTNPFDDDSMPDRSADKYGNSAELLDDMMNMAASRLNGTATTAGGAGDSPKGRADGRLGIKGGFSSNITRPGGELDDVMAMALDRLGGASQTTPSALQQTQTQNAKPDGLTKKLKDNSQEKKKAPEKTKPNLTTVAPQVKPAAANTSTEVKAPAKPPKLNSKVQPLSLPPASAVEEIQQEIEQCGSECSAWSAEFFQEPEEEIVFNQKESQKVTKPVDVSELDSILVTSTVEQADNPSEMPSKVPVQKNSPKGQILSSPSSTGKTTFAPGLASPESRTETPSPPAEAFNHPAVSPVGSGIIKALADDLSLKSGGSDKNSSDKYAVLEETTEANNSVVAQEVQGMASQRRNDTRPSSATALIEPNLCDILEDAVLPSIGSPAIPQRRHGTPIRANTTHDNGAATGGDDVKNVTSIYDPQSRIRRRQEMHKQTIALQGTVPPPPPPPPPRERRRNSQKPTQSADAGGTAFWSMLQTIADQDKQCSGGDDKYLPDQPAQTKGKHNTHPKANPQSPIGQGVNQAMTDSKKKKSKGSKVIEKPMATISVERPDPPIFPSEKERSQDSGVGETTAEGSTIPKDDAYWDTLSTIPSSTAGHKQSVKARPPKQNQLQSPDNGNDYLSCTGICAWDDELDQRRGPRPLSAAKLQGTPGHSEDADEDESRESSAFLNIPLEISYAATDNTARVKKLLDRPTDVKQSMQALDSLLLDDLSQTSSLKYSMGTGRGQVPQVTQTASEDINNATRRGQDMATDYELGKNSSSQDSSMERNPSRYGDDEGEDPAVTPSIAESRGSERRVPSKRVTIDNTAKTEQSGRKSGKVANLLAKFEAIRTGGKPDEQVPQNGSYNPDNDVSRVDNDPHTDLEGNLNVNLDSLEQIMSADSGDDPNLILGVSTDDADTTSLLLAVTRTEDYSVDSRLFEETSTATYSEKGAAKTELKAAASSVGDDSLPEKDTVSEAQVSKDESNEKLLQTAPSKLSVDTDTKQDTTKQTKREEEPHDVKSVEDNAQIINPSHTEEELMDDETSPSQKQIDHRMMEDAPTVSPLTIDDNQFDDKKSQGKSNLEEKKQTPTAPETNPERTSSPIGSSHSVSTQTEHPVDVPAAVEPKQVHDSARNDSDKTDVVKLEYAPQKEPPAVRVSSPDPPAAMPPPVDEEEGILVSSASVKAQDPSPSFEGNREQSKPTSRQTKDDKEETVPPSVGVHAVSPSDGGPKVVALKVTTDRSSDRPAPESPRTSPQRQRTGEHPSPDSQTSSYRQRLATKSLRERSVSPTKRQPMTPESQRPPSPQRRHIDTKVATTGAAVSTTTTATTERKTSRSPRLQSVLDRIELRRKEKAELAKRRANLTKEKRAAAAKSPRRTSESPGSSGLSTSRRKGSSLSSPESRQGVAFHPETDFTSVVTPTPRPLVVPNRQQRAGNSGERSHQEILTHLQQPFVEETVVPAMTNMLEQYDDIVSQLLDEKLKGRDGSVMLRTKLASLRAQKDHTIAVSRSQTPRVSRPTSPAKARGPPRPEATGERMKSPSPYSRAISPGRLRSALEAHLASSSTDVRTGDPASPRRIRREPTPYRRSGRSQGDHPPAQITLPNTNDSRPRRLLSLKSSSTPALHHEAGGTRSPYDSPPRRARSASPEKIRLSSPEKNRLLGKDGDQTRRLRQQIDMARLTSQSVRNSHASLSMELLNFKKKLYAKRGERELLTSSYRAVRSAGPTPTRQRGAAAAAASFNMSRSQPHHHQHLDSASETGAQLQHRDDETQSELTMETASDNNFSTIRGHMLKNLKLMQDAQEQGLLRRLSQEVPQQAGKQQQAVEPQMEQQPQQQQLLQQQRDEVSVGGFERSAELEVLLDRWRQTERENERLRIANEAMKQRRHQQQQSHHHHHHLLQSPREGEDYESLILELKREEREKSAKVMQCWDDAKRYAKEAERPSY